MGREIVNQVQEAQSPIQDKPKEEHAEHIVIKLTKIKDRDKILKGTCPQRWPCLLKVTQLPRAGLDTHSPTLNPKKGIMMGLRLSQTSFEVQKLFLI